MLDETRNASDRDWARNTILVVTWIVCSPAIVAMLLAGLVLGLVWLVFFLPFGLVEWAMYGTSDHPITYLLDWMFPDVPTTRE